jgi:phosphatidylinositol 3,5-bisphosphate 5-phosphatase
VPRPAYVLVAVFICGCCLFNLCFLYRYIDQGQELMDAPDTVAERKDLEKYQLMISMAMGEVPEGRRDEALETSFASYVERGSPHFWDGAGQPVGFDYERWLGANRM